MGATARPSSHYRFAARLQSVLSIDEVERTYLNAVRDVVFARGHGLYRLHPRTGEAVGVAADVDTNFLDEYEEYGRANDPVLDFIREHLRPIDSSRATKRTVWEASGAHQCLGRAGYYHSMEAPVLVAGVPCATLNFARAPGDPPFDADDLRAAQSLSEQIGLALERAIRYEETGRRATLFEDALDRLPQAVVVTDAEARIIFRNRAANRVHTDDAADPAPNLENAIIEATEMFRRHNKRVSVVAVTEGAHRRAVVKSFRLNDHDDASVSVVYPVEDAAASHLPVWDVLSPREQEIAELVSQGLTTKDIAARAFVTENTVKQHLKRIFAKTDVRNRAELMQRIWTAYRPNG